MKTRKLYQVIANKVAAWHNCQNSDYLNQEWQDRHEDDVEQLVKDHMPSGSGFDAGTTIDWDRSTGEKLVFHTSFHHMDDNGSYDGWTEHDVVVKPSLIHEFIIDVKGRNRNDIKEFIAESFDYSLSKEIEQ